MKKRSFINTRSLLMSLVFIIAISEVQILQACEACNRLFLRELVGTLRSGTLASKELLAAIHAQKSAGIALPAWVDEILADEVLISSGSVKSSAATSEAVSAGMPLATNVSKGQPQDKAGLSDFIEIMRRDERLSIPPTSFVPQTTRPDKRVRISLDERDVYIGNSVMYKGFTTDGKIPGPTIIVDEGDIVEFTIVNAGNIPHGASIHSAYTQTSKYLGKILAGDSARIVFRASMPGVYMYHCAPGGHAIPMHIIFGQYGMMLVRPKKKFELERILNKPPDIEINLIQHEYYASGKDAVDGQGKPMYTAFNGKLFRYIEEPIVGKPGDYVRINFLNVGPNLLSTFHIVGIVWDYAYWQGHPDNRFTGGQTVTAGPSDSWVIEFRIPPDEGAYLMLSHAVGSTDRGALGLLVCDKDAKPRKQVLAEGIYYTDEELEEHRKQARRTITPFGIGSPDVDAAVTFGSETKEVTVRIIGNSYYPKIIQVAPGTTVKWINEDVFTFMEGEFSGIHNVLVTDGPERFASSLLAHAESHSQVMEQEGEYTYICTPHPYMQGKVIVKKDELRTATVAGFAGNTKLTWVVLLIACAALMVGIIALIPR